LLKKIFFIAGEASGDRLAAHALRAAQDMASKRGAILDTYGIGGSECATLGAKLYYTDKDMSVIGFAEVVKRYRFFRNVFRKMVSLLDDPLTKPDVVFLVDYPGFNLRFAKEAKKRNIKVIYYVSPQVWAWKEGRIKSIIENTDELLVIFPFEEKLYKEKGHHNVKFVGHPLLELIEEEESSFIGKEAFASKHGLDPRKEWLLVFPGSRAEEVSRHLSTMEAATEKFDLENKYEKIIVKASGITVNVDRDTKVFDGSSKQIHELMSYGSLGILKSGTTTLEAGLMGLPGVICYKTSSITYIIAKNLIKLPYIGLINIVLGKPLYPELIQHNFTPDTIAEGLHTVLGNQETFTKELRNLRSLLRAPSGSTARRVAGELLAD
jgi:lipid-A-disaccharide synthase